MAAQLSQLMPQMGGIGQIALWGAVALIIGLVLGGLLYLFIIKTNRKQIIEINLVTKKITKLVAIEKRNISHKKQLYIPKLKKFIPNIQQEDLYNMKGQDVIFLVKDNNGLHHTARLPNLIELLNIYHKIHGVDLREYVRQIKGKETEEEKKNLFDSFKDKIKGADYKKKLDLIGTIYLLPNPLENIEWLANSQNEAAMIFNPGILNKPILLFVSTMLVCGIVFVISLVVTKLM